MNRCCVAGCSNTSKDGLACLNFLKKLIEGENGQSKYKGLEINGLAQHLIAMYVVHISVLIVLMKVTSLKQNLALKHKSNCCSRRMLCPLYLQDKWKKLEKRVKLPVLFQTPLHIDWHFRREKESV